MRVDRLVPWLDRLGVHIRRNVIGREFITQEVEVFARPLRQFSEACLVRQEGYFGDCFERFLALFALALSLFVGLLLLTFLLRLLALGRNLVLLDAPYALPIFSLVFARFSLVLSDGCLDHRLHGGTRDAVLLGNITTLDIEQPLDRRQASQSLRLNLQTARALLGRKLHLRKLHDFFRIVAAHCRPRRASRFLLMCALLLTAASPAFAARSMALARSCSSQARASCPRWITPSIGWSLPTN